MLVLGRRPDESILIGQTIRVTVLSVKGNQVRLGIEAPETLDIARAEILEDGAEEDDPCPRCPKVR